jgi:hypothetical protein
MKAMMGALKRPFRRASSGFVTLTIVPAGANVCDNRYGTSLWIATLRWVKRVMWLLVMVITFWDFAATFGPHFELAW